MVDNLFDSGPVEGGHQTLLAESVLWDEQQHEHRIRSTLSGVMAIYRGFLPSVTVALICQAKVEAIQPHPILVADTCTQVFDQSVMNKHNIRNTVELCSGMGCLGVGLGAAGYNVILKVDYSQPMLDLASQFPGETMHADITAQDFVARLMQRCPRAGTLAAGIACQPYSKLGDQAQQQDPRAMTLPKSLEVAYLGRYMIVILECVPEAEQCQWVQQTLQCFAQKTKYRVSQTTLHLHHTWPARRSRWWCVLVHPILAPVSIPALPSMSPRVMILHLVDHFKSCTPQEMQSLALDLYELGRFDDAGFERNTVPLKGTMATALHSCGVQLSHCPCGCRQQGFSFSRLQNGGLHGLIIPTDGQSRNGHRIYQNHRHIHPDELALFNGMLTGLDYKGNLKLGLCGLGQMASPIQSLWVGSHAMQILASAGFVPADQCVPPVETLSRYLARLIATRDQVFGVPTNINAVAFTHMINTHQYALEPLTNFLPSPMPQEPQDTGLTRETDEPLVSSQPALAAADEAGGVSGFATERKRKHATTPMPPVDHQQASVIDEQPPACSEPTSVHSSPPASPRPAPRRDPERDIEDPQDTSANLVECQLMSAVAPIPYQVRCQAGATVGMITVAEDRIGHMQLPTAPTTEMGTMIDISQPVTDQQLICLHANVAPDTRCPHSNTRHAVPHIPTGCNRITGLFCQQSWVADDEMDYYLSTVAHLPNIVPCPVRICPADTTHAVFAHKWVQDIYHLLGPHETLITATIVDNHWLPFAFAQGDHDLVITCTPEGKAWAESFLQAYQSLMFQVTIQVAALPHSFSGDCGFQSFAWLVSTARKETHQALSEQQASGWRGLFRQHLLKHELASQYCEISIGGATSDPHTHQQLSQLLVQHGVWETRASDRANAVLSTVGNKTIKQILKASLNKWADLKAAANQASPPLRLIQQDELQTQISARANQKKQFGRKPQQKKPQKPPQQMVIPRAADVMVPEGVFKQDNDQVVGPIDVHEIGPAAGGVAVIDQSEADAIMRLTRPVSAKGLAVIVLATPTNGHQHQGDPIRFPALCKLTQEPLLISGYLYQLGQQNVVRNEPKEKIIAEEQDVEVIRCLVYKDQAGPLWEGLAKQPVKAILQSEQAILGPAAGEPSPIVDVWDRQWVSKRFEKSPPEKADIFLVSFRILTRRADAVIAASGKKGIYYEPRSTCGRYPSSLYHVTWLNAAGLQEAKLAHQTAPNSISIVRHGERYGLRSDTKHAKATHDLHHPGVPLLMGTEKKLYSLGPLPYATTRDGIQKLLNTWDWEGKPLQPRGRSRDQSGIDWTIQATEDPAFWIYHLQHGDVLIARLTDDKPESKAPSMSILASRKTIAELQKTQPDPWQAGQHQDPWQAGHMAKIPAAPTSGLPQAQLTMFEANLDKKIASAVQSMNAEATASTASQEHRIHLMEQQIQQLHHNQQGFDSKLGQIQTQIDHQARQFGNTLDTKLGQALESIEQMIKKRGHPE
eukprot:Skav202941  [mRNA]  locus=scaffold422:252756:257213:- [translate_table: standard]